jgi:hypothetical protein
MTTKAAHLKAARKRMLALSNTELVRLDEVLSMCLNELIKTGGSLYHMDDDVLLLAAIKGMQR